MIIDGKKIAADIYSQIKTTIDASNGRKPHLAVLLVGTHAPSQIYIRRKMHACHMVGIQFTKKELAVDISEAELIDEIETLNQDLSVDGILVQLPLPSHINSNRITYRIDPKKDVDGFHPLNLGKLMLGETDGFIPCTPLGIKVMLDYYKIKITGKQVLIIGRSNIVGKPMASLLMQSAPNANATVTVAHRYTTNLPTLCQMADILIVAMGQPCFVTSQMVKEGAIVIDVGINKVDSSNYKEGYKIVGDVDFEAVKLKCAYITPVPGGVGPMTIAMLLSNTLKSYQMKFIQCI